VRTVTASEPQVDHPLEGCVAVTAPAGSPADRLGWMIGTWVSDEGERRTTERWCVGADGILLGENRTMAGGREVHSETLRVEARGAELVYVASPIRQATTEFRGAARCRDGGADRAHQNCSRSCEATFVNPTHDFPSEITYGRCLQSEDLVATIRGGDRRASWTFRRAAD
jgi:hypothetical protein